MDLKRFCEYFEILLDSLVGDTGLCLCLSHHVVKIFLKVLAVFDQMHGYVIICHTHSQTRQEGSEGRHHLIIYLHVVFNISDCSVHFCIGV